MEPHQKILKVHLLIQKRQRRKEKETEIDGTSRGGNDKIMEVNSTSIVIFNVMDEKLQYRVETVKLEKKKKNRKNKTPLYAFTKSFILHTRTSRLKVQ